MFLGIEIGGTKLQLGVGRDGKLHEITRLEIDPARGANGILDQILAAAPPLIAAHKITAVGIGFGGPVDQRAGNAIKSHHVEGWTGFPLVQWCRERLGLPAALGNDADVAALAEARYGAGRGKSPVLYLTVGTGIGGGFVVDGRIYRGFGQAATEIGHLRPGLAFSGPTDILESLAAGWGIAKQARRFIAKVQQGAAAAAAAGEIMWPKSAAEELLNACQGDPTRLTARMVADLAGTNPIAKEVWQQATAAIGWAVAQAITLLSPEVVVIGGGVSLAGEEKFFAPVRAAAAQYVFPPLLGNYSIVPAQLGEAVVVHGAIALAECRTPNMTFWS